MNDNRKVLVRIIYNDEGQIHFFFLTMEMFCNEDAANRKGKCLSFLIKEKKEMSQCSTGFHKIEL